jgi:hypothetical protein
MPYNTIVWLREAAHQEHERAERARAKTTQLPEFRLMATVSLNLTILHPTP